MVSKIIKLVQHTNLNDQEFAEIVNNTCFERIQVICSNFHLSICVSVTYTTNLIAFQYFGQVGIYYSSYIRVCVCVLCCVAPEQELRLGITFSVSPFGNMFT